MQLDSYARSLFFMPAIAFVISNVIAISPVDHPTSTAIVALALLIWKSGDIVEADSFRWTLKTALTIIGGVFLWIGLLSSQSLAFFFPIFVSSLCAVLIATPKSTTHRETQDQERNNPQAPPRTLETKFDRFHEISRMLRDAPHPVRRAWQEGWSDITRCQAGWFGERPIEISMRDIRIKMTNWERICTANGERPWYEPESRQSPAVEIS